MTIISIRKSGKIQTGIGSEIIIGKEQAKRGCDRVMRLHATVTLRYVWSTVLRIRALSRSILTTICGHTTESYKILWINRITNDEVPHSLNKDIKFTHTIKKEVLSKL